MKDMVIFYKLYQKSGISMKLICLRKLGLNNPVKRDKHSCMSFGNRISKLALTLYICHKDQSLSCDFRCVMQDRYEILNSPGKEVE